MMLLVLVLYVSLLYCTYRAILQSERMLALKHNRVYDKQRRMREIRAANERLVCLIVMVIVLVLSVMVTILLGV